MAFGRSECIFEAPVPHGAPPADLFGRTYSTRTGFASFVVGVEEHRGVGVPAGRGQLPVPFLGDGDGQPHRQGRQLRSFLARR
jgi:hypothetical protein